MILLCGIVIGFMIGLFVAMSWDYNYRRKKKEEERYEKYWKDKENTK